MQGTLIAAAREVGDLPLSIPTSLAMEALFVEDKNGDSSKPKSLFVNVRTLFRNLWSSLEAAAREPLDATAFADVVKQEMDFIQGYVAEKSMGKFVLVFYICSYDDLAQRLPRAILKTANTDKQRLYLKREMETTNIVKNDYGETHKIENFRTQITMREHAVLLTHSPIDLLFNDFYSAVLLESHTGKLKLPYEWNSKLTNGKDLSHLPFNKFTIQVFGDNNTYISQMPMKIKKVVLEMAEKDNWSAVTTVDKIRFSLKKLRDHYARDYLLQVLKS